MNGPAATMRTTAANSKTVQKIWRLLARINKDVSAPTLSAVA